jgi:hypothetical protein
MQEGDVAVSCPLNGRETGVTIAQYKTAGHCLMRKWQQHLYPLEKGSRISSQSSH